MKKILGLSLLLVLVIRFASCQTVPDATKATDTSKRPVVTSGLRKTTSKSDTSIDEDKAKDVMRTISALLEGYNYDAHEINDDASKKIFELFIKKLDPGKHFLLTEDIAELKKSETKIDDEIHNGFLAFEATSFAIKTKRILQVEVILQKIFSSSINVVKTEMMEKDPETMPWCNSIEELEIRWQKIIRQLVVSTYVSMLIEKEMTSIAAKKTEEGAANKTKSKEEAVEEPTPIVENPLTGDSLDNGSDKNPIDYSKLSQLPLDESKLKEAVEKVKKNLGIRFKRLKEEGEVGNFNNYMNAVCGSFDPHSAYHMPDEKESIDIDLTGSLQGIGAQLQEDGEEVQVTKIIPGSASWKQKQLAVKDVVLKVAQGSQEPVDIRGMSLNDSVRLIRGKKGTEVRLTVKKPDGQIVVIPIVRDVVVLEDSYVHSEVIEDKLTGQKIGFILLPSFYLEQDGGKGRSCAADVKKDLIALKEKNVDGIVFDLRSNGGGSLKDVIDMAGFFINGGPIVQVKGTNGQRKVYDDPDKNVIYDGPLVVLVSNMSASASEIFAAALQDYGRAVILGSGLSSFGKGTVQTFVPLAENTKNKDFDIGSLRLSIQKFYRINGQTTQFKGVIPDIVLPVEYMYMDIGEKFLDNPLPSDLFFPTTYEKWNNGPNLATAKPLSEKRVSENIFFTKVGEYALYLKNRREEKTIKVSIGESFKELEDAQKKNLEFKKIKETKREIKLSRITAVNSADSGMFKDIEAFLPKDQYVFEAISIIKDIKQAK